MSYNDPYGFEWLSPSFSPPPYPAIPPNTAAKVHELMTELEKQTIRRTSQSPSPGSMRRQYLHLTTNFRQTLVRNLGIVEYAGMPVSPRVFTCFARLPTETRRRIWRFALPGPRIVELEKRGILDFSGVMSWQYVPRNLPPLLQTCRESRTIARRSYRIEKQQNKIGGVPSTPWIRYDQDIAYPGSRFLSRGAWVRVVW
ncbi:hypothetical protein BKA64DRAFT_59955 [Cadophora sp. MPI-SDFR-AT-0126]|nr:hypothetical protein BKA64DRAFT_59955 [Leotiomycetes sp. MPI-SDFR-AT-0126]